MNVEEDIVVEQFQEMELKFLKLAENQLEEIVQQLQEENVNGIDFLMVVKKKVCCVSRWRAQVRIFNTCYSGETKCKRIQKRSCWNKESKSLKRGKCHIKSCCDVRLNHNTKKLKTIKKTCSIHVSCIKNAVHTHQRCHWRAETNECRRRVCCKNKYLNGSLLSRKCKRGTLHCPTKRFTSCRWKDSTNKCKERKCCTKVFRAGRIISNKCKLARRKCQNSNKNKMFMEKRRKM